MKEGMAVKRWRLVFVLGYDSAVVDRCRSIRHKDMNVRGTRGFTLLLRLEDTWIMISPLQERLQGVTLKGPPTVISTNYDIPDKHTCAHFPNSPQLVMRVQRLLSDFNEVATRYNAYLPTPSRCRLAKKLTNKLYVV